MRMLRRYLGAPVAAIAIAALWGAIPAGASTTRTVHAGQSIQAAVDHAKAGDTIVVERGTYAENVEILKGDIHLIGHDATIVPPATPHPGSKCFSPEDPTSLSGICVLSPFANLDTGVVTKYLKGTVVTGFTVKGFSGNGFVAFGAQDTEVTHNRFLDNGEYGAAAFTSTQTSFEHNASITTAPSAEAGFYIGDSPNANAEVEHNVSSGAQFGVFVRDAFEAHIEQNDISGNCVGIVFLADAPGPAGHSNADHNDVHDNDRFCPPGEDGGPSTSGVGIASAGATDTHVHENRIVNNVPSGPAGLSGGLVVVQVGPTPPTHNHMTSNVVKGNGTDVFWDGSGVDNLFFDNHCATSVPAGLCKK